jgi:transposase InsO family protein
MKENGLNAKSGRKFIPAADSNRGLPVCGKRVSDITYLRTRSGWVYLTAVMDLYGRNIIGWPFSTDMTAERTAISALVMAYMNRRPRDGLIFHSGRGVRYCAASFRQSMSRKGNCRDNACIEASYVSVCIRLLTIGPLMCLTQTKPFNAVHLTG